MVTKLLIHNRIHSRRSDHKTKPIEIEPTKRALVAAIQNVLQDRTITPDMVHVHPYREDTHEVTVFGHGVFGYIDEPLQRGETEKMNPPLTTAEKRAFDEYTDFFNREKDEVTSTLGAIMLQLRANLYVVNNLLEKLKSGQVQASSDDDEEWLLNAKRNIELFRQLLQDAEALLDDYTPEKALETTTDIIDTELPNTSPFNTPFGHDHVMPLGLAMVWVTCRTVYAQLTHCSCDVFDIHRRICDAQPEERLPDELDIAISHLEDAVEKLQRNMG